MNLGKYSFGTGDRFGMQGIAQLKAILRGRELGVDIVPVWNKSNREHQIIGTDPVEVRDEADESVSQLNYAGSYFVDADHINDETVDRFIEYSDFFTLDVAGYIGQRTGKQERENALRYFEEFIGIILIDGIDEPFKVDRNFIESVLDKYLLAINKAGSLYKKLVQEKGEENFIAEVSMDEVDSPQSPLELYFILALISRENIKVQTIAPKFSGRFNKGVDYVGDIDDFRKEFEEDLLVIKQAVKVFGLPSNLKLSIHSGSDKFRIYPVMGELIRKHDIGIHVKTAGTTWLEEVIGLSLGDDDAVKLVKDIYKEAMHRIDELCGPYTDVIDIDRAKLPSTDSFMSWSGKQIAESIIHIPSNKNYNLNIRQLLHVAYKLAAEKGEVFKDALERNKEVISEQVETNIFERHLVRLFRS